ncbi:hypothetical protein Rumeso_01670 [Rubellimicrobium mesophilum DSM 19309]|uniref:TadE-like domain-containing protein n=1 Tax=Rubellimicrobium mesophilum DSM 19309 TaxID=442562 RepID=A0A017HQD1_9RHOB|nr:TadE/TadG family type IV pilus assembly protein [Rubellimicrobium mesophilum]EYD76712.1 hypothetical protein Rumeso_01670 [Rubellimicrobium mesophilum DSM 19309]
MSATHHLRRLRRDDRGTTVVELAFVIPLLLLFFFVLLDFGRLTYTWAMAEKATSMAARMAAVRTPVDCGGKTLPLTNARVTGSAVQFGASCRPQNPSDPSPCVAVAAMVCSGTSANATANRIFTTIQPLLPNGAGAGNLKFTYTNDPSMNFLGGPYVPS